MNFGGSNGLGRPCLLACVALTAAGTALARVEAPVADDNPYAVISQHNVFHLTDPPPPPSAAEEKPPELPKVLLTGFLETAHISRVLMVKPPKSATNSPIYLSLKIGERKDGVEVLRIRAEKGEVDIINAGTAMTLNASNVYSGSGIVAKGNGDLRGEFHGPNGSIMNALPGARRMPRQPFGIPPSGAVPDAASSIASGNGSSAIILGGGGYGASPSPGAGSGSPNFPRAGLPGSMGAGGIPGNGSSAGLEGDPGAEGGVPTPQPGVTPHSLSSAQMQQYMAALAAQNQGATPQPVPQPRP